MWLFTRHGFYSVVRATEEVGCVQVRARISDDLERLRAFAASRLGATLPEIISTVHADYAYRLVVPHPLWVKISAALAEDIDYGNFKSEVHLEADRDAAYLEVWSAMSNLQRKRARNGFR
jgi:hypothetical protein